MAKAKLGNAKCTKCGLRASSKNVALRSVFRCWPDDDGYLSAIENMVRIYTHEEHDYIRIIHHDDQTPAQAMTLWFKSVYEHNPAKYERNIEKLLCSHTWRQDRGTATV